MKNTILIFDDDAEILQICTIILESKGFKVVMENCCENVVEKVISSRADVVLMDNSIPQIGGIEATRLIKQNESTRDVPVIFFSANFNVASLSRQAGADYYLPKPFDICTLEEMVMQAVGDFSRTTS